MDADYTKEYEDFELRHWWFVARRRIIHGALDRYASAARRDGARWLDVGCGTGVLLDSYRAIANPNKLGLELDPGSVERARAKGLDVRRAEATWSFGQYGRFDLVTLTDVLEHVEGEREAIDAVREVLAPGGILLITVPALMSLWSGHDVVNRHYRRYTHRTLLALFPSDQWEVLKVSYFSSWLLPMIWLARKWKNFRERGAAARAHATHDFKFGRFDPLLKLIFLSESLWLKWGSFPLGSSILLVLRNKGKPAGSSALLGNERVETLAAVAPRGES